MKVFISWSGELSKKVASELKKWLPCIIQSIEVFYSPDDIEKGENWDSKISTELSECNYGIVCLTSENKKAPWINFEAGAIAKTLDSKVSALLIDVSPSEIQGPLKRYQATKLEREDVWQLISEINNASVPPLPLNVLQQTFDAIWDKMYNAIKSDVENYKPKNELQNKVDIENDKAKISGAIEEILQLVRKQNVLLGTPEKLLPVNYIQKTMKNLSVQNVSVVENSINIDDTYSFDDLIEDILIGIANLLDKIEDNSQDINSRRLLTELKIIDILTDILFSIDMWCNVSNRIPKIDDMLLKLLNKINKCTELMNGVQHYDNN